MATRSESSVRDQGAGSKATSTDDLQTDIADLKSDVQRLIKDMSAVVGNKVHHEAKSVEHLAHLAEERTGELADHARAEVRRNPLGACALAAGLGLVLGMLMSR